ncbi:response regulator transcription factor [Streptomyces sp. NBC_01304]|uniref:response regulator transcription factor n=1 Tax=Streptomyces sp. NBC_01304 TaxID=2903818 RepID=UPI002E11555F|nr:response regulator transcription factor [Streptomyces sp. NBC_01304]
MENATRGHVLVVDDDPTVAEVVSGYLTRAGYAVDRADEGRSALDRAAAHRPDLVVLDLMLPGMSGFEVCRRLREQGPVPVIMLTARGDEEDRILGLEIGADDYVTKPFSPRELVLRVESVLRRAHSAAAPPDPGPPALLTAAALRVDPAARRATKDGAELALTVREFDLLTFFLRHPDRAFTREELMREVWGWDFGDLSTVTVHIRRLRGKIEDDPASPRLIRTVWGVGYRFGSLGSAGAEQGAGGERAEGAVTLAPGSDAEPLAAGSDAEPLAADPDTEPLAADPDTEPLAADPDPDPGDAAGSPSPRER